MADSLNFSVVSWSFLPYHFGIEMKKKSKDPADPSFAYADYKFMNEEKRMKFLMDFILSQEADTLVCIQRVTPQFVTLYFNSNNPEDLPYSNIFFKCRTDESKHAVYIIDQVNPKNALPQAGKQGILIVYSSYSFILDQSDILSISNPFYYYFGMGSLQVFIPMAYLGKKFWFAGAESNPMSWPLLYEEKDQKSILYRPSSRNPKNSKHIVLLTIAKPSLTFHYLPLSDELLKNNFDPRKLLEEIPDTVFPKEYFAQEVPFGLDSTSDCPNIPSSYPEKVVSRYRFLMFTRPDFKDISIQSTKDVQDKLDMEYIRTKILNHDAKFQVLPDEKNLSWKTFNPQTDILIVVDALFCAEVDCLLLRERINWFTEESIPWIVCVSFPYDLKRSRLSDLVIGNDTKWVQDLKGGASEATFFIAISGVAPFFNPTWFLPKYIRECPTNSRTYFAYDLKCLEPGTDMVDWCSFEYNSRKKTNIRTGILSDNVYTSLEFQGGPWYLKLSQKDIPEEHQLQLNDRTVIFVRVKID